MSRRATRLFVIGLTVVMVGLAVVAIATRQPQYRLPMHPDTPITADFVQEKTRLMLEKHGLEPVAPLPNPSDPDGGVYAPWPDNPIYGYILWQVRDPAQPDVLQTWRVQTKPLEDEFIGWPRQVE